MMIFLHVLIAIFSVGYATFTAIRPTGFRLRISYILVVATITSGFYLVVNAPAHMMQACLMGLGYLGVVTIAIVAAKIRLTAAIKNHN